MYAISNTEGLVLICDRLRIGHERIWDPGSGMICTSHHYFSYGRDTQELSACHPADTEAALRCGTTEVTNTSRGMIGLPTYDLVNFKA